ncbi:MAG: N-methyl-L-tryptophan oxidase [Chloroflexi bacterium]|nr:MAG: N-methyl-L-tryptophan oxidase [Chloroflexota bacterium]
MYDSYDSIVIGAGVMGSAAAYHLAKDGRRVLLIEQFKVGHTHGSSHGGSRIIRYTHDDVAYVRLMPAIFELWRRLEAESGIPLLQMTGGLYLGPEDEAFLCGAQQALQTLQYPYESLSPTELPARFPQFRIPSGWLALYQEQSGILAATRCVETLARQAVRCGATVREQTQVQAVRPEGGGVAVRLAGAGGEETVYAAQAVITAGPWTQRLLAPLLPYALPLQVTHQQVAYFAVEQPDLYAVGRCPLYIFTALPHFYGFPIFERAGEIKVGMELVGTVVDPDAPRTAMDTAIPELSAAIERTLVGVRPEPTRVELCLYTETPNHHFIIDRHPEHPQILIAGGFSGRGFKFGIAVGRLLADLAASAPGVYESEFWLPRFAVTRFAH